MKNSAKRTDSAHSKHTNGGKANAPSTNLYPNSTTKNFRTTEEEVGQLRNQYKLIRKFHLTFFI
jgi:hypothetical protein